MFVIEIRLAGAGELDIGDGFVFVTFKYPKTCLFVMVSPHPASNKIFTLVFQFPASFSGIQMN